MFCCKEWTLGTVSPSSKEKAHKTRPSILCVTQKRAFMPLYIVLGQHRACMPVYIGKSGDLVGWHRCLTYSQTTEYRATQLVSSITHKLSHAINKSNSFWDTLLGGYMGLYLCVFFVPIVSLLKRRRCWCSPPQSAQPLRKPLADEEELMRASGFIYFICSIVHLYLYSYLFLYLCL